MTKKKKSRTKKLTADQLEMARKYESVWHYMYAQLPAHVQKWITSDPLGLSASEFAKRVARKAESDCPADKIEEEEE